MNNALAVVDMADNDEGFAFHELVPPGIDSRRVLAGFKTAVLSSEKLRACSLDSLAEAALDCARLGLWPGPHGHMYLIPYGQTATPVVGYKGLIALVKRLTGARVEARLVHEHDSFAMIYGTAPGISHEPLIGERGAPIGVYAVAHFPDGSNQFEYMSADQIEGIRAGSKAGNAGPWVDHPGEMWRKTATRRLIKYIGMDETIGHAFTVNDKAEGYLDPPAPVTNQSGPRRSPASLAARFSPAALPAPDSQT